MGIKIAITALIIFIFSVIFANIAKDEPRNPRIFFVSSVVALLSMSAIPIGLIIEIWL